MLDVDDLVRTYGPVRALDGMTFSVRPGVVTGFLGPNGAGKTTTMRAIFGLTALDAGGGAWNGSADHRRDAPPLRLPPRGARALPEHAHRRPAGLPRSAARTEQGDGERTGAFVAATPRPRRPGAEQPRGALARQPAARAADQRPGARAGRAGARRAVLRARPGRRRRAVQGARRARPAAARRCSSRRTSSTSSSTCARTPIIVDRGRAVAHGALDDLTAGHDPVLAIDVPSDADAARGPLASTRRTSACSAPSTVRCA